MKIYVHKFGGVGLKSASRIKKMIAHLRGGGYMHDNIIVCSAISGVTRLLGRLFNVMQNRELDRSFQLEEGRGWIEQFELLHINLIEELFTEKNAEKKAKDDFLFLVNDLTVLLEAENPVNFNNPDFEHSRLKACILRYGEFASSRIISNYISFCGISNKFLDSREFIKTIQAEGDPVFDHSNAILDFVETKKCIDEIIVPILVDYNVFVCQGYVARDSNTGEDTLLGFDGSDYTASVIGFLLKASRVSFWKDVKGVMSSDPHKNPDAVRCPFLHYSEYFELCIKNNSWPVREDAVRLLSTARIPVVVKWLDNPSSDGTVID